MKWYLLTYYSIIAVGISVGLLRYSSLAKSSKVIVFLLISSLVVELITNTLSGITSHYLLVYAIFQPVEFSLITYAFYHELQIKYILWVVSSYILFVIINGVWIQPAHITFTTYPIILTVMLTSLWALLYLRRLLRYPTDFNINDFTLFWYSTGLLLFNVIAIFAYGPFNYIDKHLYEVIGPAFRVVRIVANHVLYIMAIFTILSKQKSLHIFKKHERAV